MTLCSRGRLVIPTKVGFAARNDRSSCDSASSVDASKYDFVVFQMVDGENAYNELFVWIDSR